MAVAVDPRGDEHHGVDHPAALADLHAQRVGGHERERTRLVQGPVPEGLDLLVQIGGHPAHLGLRQGVDAQGLDQLGGTSRCDHREARSGGAIRRVETPAR